LEDVAPDLQEDKANTKESKVVRTESDETPKPLWSMDFDGAMRKEGDGAWVWIHNHKSRYSKIHSYKLNFHCTNNIAEYEALMLGLKLLKKHGAKIIMVRGDSEMVVKQIKGEYSSKPPRLRAYRNVVLDFLQCFTEIDLQVMPRCHNILADGLDTSKST
jgi:hypothetical protein